MSVTVTETVVKRQPVVVEQWLAQDLEESERIQELSKQKQFRHRDNIVWRNVAAFAVLHTFSAFGLYHMLAVAHWRTVFWSVFLWVVGGVGITAGPHRLWAHKSYKARAPLRAILVTMNLVSFQNSIIEWVRDHFAHHKWSDTDADPHNINRGFFFAHMGWLLSKKHPMVREMGKKLDMSDLYADPLLFYQHKFYLPLTIIMCFLVPTAVPMLYWGESAWVSFCLAAAFRYCFTLHATWFINSAAHTFGYRPYDISIAPTESLITTLTAFGEGGHNYHHTFPQDYRTSEMPGVFNFTKSFIDFFAKLGWAYELRTVGPESIARQIDRQFDVQKKHEMVNGSAKVIAAARQRQVA
jgi:stearoyl-CoA desaturase (delta-9 desaturase)